jgi:membrane-bound ClpP family serine protease
VLLLLADPTIVFLLLVMAGIAIYAELVTPTVGILAGVGAVLFFAALVGIFALPVNWVAVIALVFAFGLIAADLYLAAHGSLTVVGLVVLVVSALNLYDNAQAPGIFVALWAIALVVCAGRCICRVWVSGWSCAPVAGRLRPVRKAWSVGWPRYGRGSNRREWSLSKGRSGGPSAKMVMSNPVNMFG